MVLLTTNGMAVDDMTAAPSGPGLAKGLGDQVDAFYGGNVANAAALPASGKFPGQRVWLVDVKGWAVWSSTGWNYDISLAAPTSFGSGWSNVGGSDVTQADRVDDMVTLYVAANKSAGSGAGEAVCTFGPGLRPKRTIYGLLQNASQPRYVSVSTTGVLSSLPALGAGSATLLGVLTFPAARS